MAAKVYMPHYCSIDQPAWIVSTAPELTGRHIKTMKSHNRHSLARLVSKLCLNCLAFRWSTAIGV